MDNVNNEIEPDVNDLFQVCLTIYHYSYYHYVSGFTLPFLISTSTLHYLYGNKLLLYTSLTYFQELNDVTEREIKNFDSLTIGTIYQITEMYMKQTPSGDQVVGGIVPKDQENDTIRFVYLVTSLTKKFNAQKVSMWNAKITKGAKAYFKYIGKEKIKFGCGYKFNATWVKAN